MGKIHEVLGIRDKRTGKVSIDTFSLKVVLDFYLDKDNPPTVKEDLTPQSPKISEEISDASIRIHTIKKTITALMDACAVKSFKEQQSAETIMISAPNLNIRFYKERIRYYGEAITWLLDQLKDTDSLEGLSTLKTGETWTTIQQPISFLLALAFAAELLPPRKTIENTENQQLRREKNNH